MGFAVDANVGHRVEPGVSCRIDGGERGHFQAGQEVLLDVSPPVLHTALLVGAPRCRRLMSNP